MFLPQHVIHGTIKEIAFSLFKKYIEEDYNVLIYYGPFWLDTYSGTGKIRMKCGLHPSYVKPELSPEFKEEFLKHMEQITLNYRLHLNL